MESKHTVKSYPTRRGMALVHAMVWISIMLRREAVPQNVLLHLYKIPRTSESQKIESTLVSASLGDRGTGQSMSNGNRVSIHSDQELDYTTEKC